MTESTFSIDELRTLTNMACNGELTKQAVAQLEQLLYDNAQAQQFYLTHVCLDRRLRWEFAHQVQKPAIPQSAPSLGIFSTVIHGTIGFFSQELQFSLLIATLLTGIGLWIASLVYVSSPEKIAKDSPSFPTKSSADPKMEIVGRITGMVDCRWADPNTETFRGDNVLLGRKYALASGLMEITYGTGAKVILQGPVIYQVESRDGGFLSLGKLTARLDGAKPQAANQKSSLSSIHYPLFTIKTPTVTVTDLGTEFGIEVDGSGVTTSHVFQGSVKVVVIDDEGNVGQNNKVGRANADQAGVSAKVVDREVLLHADESARTGQKLGDSGQKIVFVRRATVEASNFCRTLPPSESAQQAKYARKSEDYGKLVLSMQPTLYYRMEPPKDGDPKVLYDSAPGKHHGTIHFADGYVDTSPYEQGRFGQSFRLRGPMVGDYALVKDYPKTTDGRLTVSAWVLAMGRAQVAVIAANRSLALNEGQFVLYFSQLSRSNFAGRGREPNGGEAVAQEGQAWDSAFPLGKWQHVAQVFDGTTMRLYRNGTEVASCPCHGLMNDSRLKHLTIGCQNNLENDMTSFWPGKIDELAFFHRALSVEEIRQLSRSLEATH